MRGLRLRWPAWGIALLALASSAVGIVNWFTYDDRYVVELNPATRNLHGWWHAFQQSYWPKDWGGDGYRPLTIIAFKVESAIGKGIPATFHAANILLYAAVSVLVYLLARRVLPQWAAWLAAALFAVHPVHVEAVANIVGQSELLVAVAVLGALILYVRDRQQGPLRLPTALGILALYAFACFSKEHGIVLPAVLGAAELTLFHDDRARWRERVRQLRPFYLALTLVAVTFVAVRAAVLADHGLGGFAPFTPFNTLKISGPDRVLTAVAVVPQWIRLLFWPAHLSSEYGPPAIEIAQGISYTQLPGLMLLVATLGLGLALRRTQRVISFGIAFTCIALLPSSNFVLPAGIVLAERTLFLPSVGAMLVLGEVAVLIADALRRRGADSRRVMYVAAAASAVVLLTGAVRSSLRTRVWKDNITLFRQAVIDSPDAYRAHYMLGLWDFEMKRKREGEAELHKALTLFPYDPFLAFNMAEQYRLVGLCKPAIPLYRWAWGLDPDFPMGRTGFAGCLLDEGQYDEGKAMALKAISNGGSIKLLRRMIVFADSAKAARAGNHSPGSLSLAGSSGKMRDTVQKARHPSRSKSGE